MSAYWRNRVEQRMSGFRLFIAHTVLTVTLILVLVLLGVGGAITLEVMAGVSVIMAISLILHSLRFALNEVRAVMGMQERGFDDLHDER